MRRLLLTSLFVMGLMFSNSLYAQTSAPKSEEKKDYLLVVHMSKSWVENHQMMQRLKDKEGYEDAGLYENEITGRCYVYVERYYSKEGADYAVSWYKSNKPEFTRVWAKPVPVGSEGVKKEY